MNYLRRAELKDFFSCMGVETAYKMFELFKGDKTDYILNIETPYHEKKHGELANNIHQFKGAASLLKADALVEVLIEFEKAAKEEDAEKETFFLDKMRKTYRLTIKEMETLFEEMEET